MSEVNELGAAQQFIEQGMPVQAQPMLWKLYQSKDPAIALNAGLSLLAALHHVTQNDTLLQITERSIGIASALGKGDIHTFLLVQKAEFLFRKLCHQLYQQQNLKLAANAFRWIDFSLQEDKAEYAALDESRKQLEKEISNLEAGALKELQNNPDHYFQGKILMGLAEVSFSRFMYDLGLLVSAGPWKSKIMNLYYVRRWNLNRLLGYDRKARRKLQHSFDDATTRYKRALDEFTAGQHQSDAANAAYALALKHAMTFHFSKATNFLSLAKRLGDADRDKNLFIHIADLDKLIKDRYRHPRNWVEEFGWDLPRALRNQNRVRREP